MQEMELDVATDFRDSYHLNEKGAAKVSKHFGAYLKSNFEFTDRRKDEDNNSWDEALAYQERLKRTSLDFSEVRTVTECKEKMDNEKGYVTVLTYNGDKDFVQYQWMYESGQETYAKVWYEDGIERTKIGNADLVIVRNAKILQIYIENQNYHNSQKNWSVIIYDTITDEVVEQLDFDE